MWGKGSHFTVMPLSWPVPTLASAPPLHHCPLVHVTTELGALLKICGFRGVQSVQVLVSQARFTDGTGKSRRVCRLPTPHTAPLALSHICLPFCVPSSTPRKTYKKGHGHRQAEAWENFENSSEWKTAPLKFGKPGSFCSAQDPRSPATTSAPRRVAMLPHRGEGLASSQPLLPTHEHASVASAGGACQYGQMSFLKLLRVTSS